jgi:hypothetical protein
MNPTRIIYPQYWLNFNVQTMFPAHLALLKAQYYFEKEFGYEGLKALALLN